MERRTWVPRRRYGRIGVTGAFAVAALVLILIVSWIIDQRAAPASDRAIVDLARNGSDPVDLVVRAARANRIVFLADIHNSSVAKQFAAKAVADVVERSGLDAVVIEVGSDLQPFIDAYLERAPEDASILLTHAGTVREPGAATRAYLDLYHAIWQLNQRLGPDQRIRIVAVDLPGLSRVNSPSEGARRMAERAEAMQQAVDHLLASAPRSRLMVFMTGLHALKDGELVLSIGGTAPVRTKPLAARLAQTEQVFTILVDAPAAASAGRELAPYLGTRVADVLAEAGFRKSVGLAVGDEFDHLRQPVREARTPGMEFGIMPRDYRLQDVADAYIYLGR